MDAVVGGAEEDVGGTCIIKGRDVFEALDGRNDAAHEVGGKGNESEAETEGGTVPFCGSGKEIRDGRDLDKEEPLGTGESQHFFPRDFFAHHDKGEGVAGCADELKSSDIRKHRKSLHGNGLFSGEGQCQEKLCRMAGFFFGEKG